MAERDQFYQQQQADKLKDKNQYTNMPVDKIIHGKVQPPPEPLPQPKDKEEYKQLFKPELLEPRESIRRNKDYIHKVMAPSFLTDDNHNPNYSKG